MPAVTPTDTTTVRTVPDATGVTRPVAQVATDVLGVEADEELLQKADRVQGNPFLLVEFFRGLQDDLLVSLEAGRATLIEDRLPHRVSDSMRGRLARMSSASERAAAVEPRPS